MDPLICTEGISRCLKRKYIKRFKGGLLKYETVGKFLADIKKEFEGGDEESTKVAKLRRLEQESRTMKEFVQEFRRAARRSRYEGRLLVEEFKRELSTTIH